MTFAPAYRRNSFDWSTLVCPTDKPVKIEMCPCGRGLPRHECAPKHVKERSTFRTNLFGPPKTFKIAAADMESFRRGKNPRSGIAPDPNAKAGFDDVHRVGLDTGQEQIEFKNSDTSKQAFDPSQRAYEKGGSIRQYLDHVLHPRYQHAHSKDGFGGWIHVFHNGGRFDLNHLLMALTRMPKNEGWKIEPIVNGDRVISITVTRRKGKKKITHKFLDSGLPLSLARIGEIIGVKKLVETDLNMREDDVRWTIYVLQDCKVLRVGMEIFQRAVNDLGGQWKQTLPGTAIDLFRRFASAAISDGEEVKIHRNRHFVECPDVCKKCQQVKCWKSCPARLVREEVIAHWKWDATLQVHRGECEWSPDGCAHFFFRRSFFGGRTEMFRQNYINPYFNPLTKEYKPPKRMEIVDFKTKKVIRVPYRSPFRIFDINSSYPASMLSVMPTGRMVSYVGMKLFSKIWPKVLEGRDTRAGFIECTVYIPKGLPYPPLPVRHDGKIKFPTGYVQGVWTSGELAIAVGMGVQIRRVHRHCWIVQRAVFRGMIMKLWGLRKEALAMEKLEPGRGHAGRAEVFKLIMNSFFGKWGMGEYRDEFLIADEEGLPDNCIPYPGYETDYARRTKHVDEDYINPAIASKITSESRIRLLRAFLEVHAEMELARVRVGDCEKFVSDLMMITHGAIWYSDTDSLHCNRSMPQWIATQKELGGLKDEYPDNCIVMCRYDTAKVYELFLAGPCPKGCGHRKQNKETKQYDQPCKEKIHVIVKSKGLQNPSSEKLADLRAGKSLPQRSIPKFRKLIRTGFKIFTTRYEDDVDDKTGKPLCAKSMTMKYDKRKLDKITGETVPDHFEIDDVVFEKRAKFTPNQKLLDKLQMSVRDREESWANDTRLANP